MKVERWGHVSGRVEMGKWTGGEVKVEKRRHENGRVGTLSGKVEETVG